MAAEPLPVTVLSDGIAIGGLDGARYLTTWRVYAPADFTETDAQEVVRDAARALLAEDGEQPDRPAVGDIVRTDNGRMALVVGVDMVALVVKDGTSSFGDYWPVDRLTVLPPDEPPSLVGEHTVEPGEEGP
jgi:hypothetical protein